MFVDGFRTGQRDDAALGAAADGAADMRQRGGARAGRQDEFAQGGQVGIVVGQHGVQAQHMFFLDQLVAGDAQFTAEVEQIVLDGDQLATRTGDNGSTGLGDGSRTSKDSLRVHAMGDVDELNSQLGLSSSTSPMAWTRRLSLLVRLPSPRPVLPLSPVRVASWSPSSTICSTSAVNCASPATS